MDAFPGFTRWSYAGPKANGYFFLVGHSFHFSIVPGGGGNAHLSNLLSLVTFE